MKISFKKITSALLLAVISIAILGNQKTFASEYSEYPFPSGFETFSTKMTLGPDQNIWSIEGGSAGAAPTRIAKTLSDGTHVLYDIPSPLGSSWEDCDSGGATAGITSGPDGNLWFPVLCNPDESGNETSYVYKLTTGGVATIYLIDDPFTNSTVIGPFLIVSGPDGNLWVTYSKDNSDSNSFFVKINTSGQTLGYYETPEPTWPISLSPDSTDSIWFSDLRSGTGRAGKINMQGQISYYNLPAGGHPLSSTIYSAGEPVFVGASYSGDVEDSSSSENLRYSLFKFDEVEQLAETTIIPQDYGIRSNVPFGTDVVVRNDSLWFNGFSTTLGTLKSSGELGYAQVLPADSTKRITNIEVKDDGSIWGGLYDTSAQKFTSVFKYVPDEEVTSGTLPTAPKTGRLAVATLITTSILVSVLLLARAYQKKYHIGSNSVR